MNIVNFVRTESPTHLLEDLWNMESIGISSKGAGDNSSKKDLEEIAARLFDDTASRLPDGLYEVRWPWKPDKGEVPTNEGQALARLEVYERHLRKNGNLKQCDDVIQDYVEH